MGKSIFSYHGAKTKWKHCIAAGDQTWRCRLWWWDLGVVGGENIMSSPPFDWLLFLLGVKNSLLILSKFCEYVIGLYVKCQIFLLLTEEFIAEWKLTASDAYASVWQCYQCLNWCREVVRIRLVSLLSPWWRIWMWRSGWWQLEVAQRPADAADNAAGSRKWLEIKMGASVFKNYQI